MKCECGSQIPLHCRLCPSCNEDVGFPNVRAAQLDDEVEELNRRLAQARVSADAGSYTNVFDDFGADVAAHSKAVIARSLGVIMNLLESEHNTYTTYAQQLQSGARTSSDNEFDRTRNQFENCLFPNYYQEIRFAALSLNERWLPSFGPFAIVLKTAFIAKRASVFEENPKRFADRMGVLLNDNFPPGFRAPWANRAAVAQAKIYPRLDAATKSDEYAGLLMAERSGSTGDEEYVEVHIYGGFNLNAIEKIVGKRPSNREDRLLWSALKVKAGRAGVAVEEL